VTKSAKELPTTSTWWYGGGGGVTRPLPMDEGVVGHAPRSGPEVKNRSGAEDGAPERLGCGTVKEEVSQILQRCSYPLL